MSTDAITRGQGRSNRRWIIILALALLVLAYVVLRELGIINAEWTLLSIIAAPFVAIAKAIQNALGVNRAEEDAIRQRFDHLRAEDDARFRSIKEQNEQIESDVRRHEGELREVDARIGEVRTERGSVRREVRSESTSEIRRKAQEYWRSVNAEG